MMMVVEYMEPGKIRDEWLIYTETTPFNSVEVEVPVGKNYEFRVSLQEPIEGGKKVTIILLRNLILFNVIQNRTKRIAY